VAADGGGDVDDLQDMIRDGLQASGRVAHLVLHHHPRKSYEVWRPWQVEHDEVRRPWPVDEDEVLALCDDALGPLDNGTHQGLIVVIVVPCADLALPLRLVIDDEVGDLVLLVGEVSEAVEAEAEGVDADINRGVVLANGIV
jgi:diadenosine tetraphosphate (Ap4A) HIT family hydrolase